MPRWGACHLGTPDRRAGTPGRPPPPPARLHPRPSRRATSPPLEAQGSPSCAACTSHTPGSQPGRCCRLEASAAALAALKRTTVLADVFRIWFDGSCGTISGLRLGRTAQQAVGWEEVNAAWGQAVLLLATLAKVRGPWDEVGLCVCECVRVWAWQGFGRAWEQGSCPPGSGAHTSRPLPAAGVWAHAWHIRLWPVCPPPLQACGVRFRSYRLLPQGSYPQVCCLARIARPPLAPHPSPRPPPPHTCMAWVQQGFAPLPDPRTPARPSHDCAKLARGLQVADARGGATYDLHGPVSKFLCHSYDKAQVGSFRLAAMPPPLDGIHRARLALRRHGWPPRAAPPAPAPRRLASSPA